MTHVTLTRTIADLLHVVPPNDAVDTPPLTDVWESSVPVVPAS